MNPTEIRVWAIFAVIFALMVYFVYLKWKYTRDARGNVLALIRNKAGRWRFEKLRIEDGMVELPPKREGEAGKTYTVDSESAPDIDYPINKVSFVQTTIPLVVFNEENFDPISNVSGRPVLPPKLLYIMRHEDWSAHGIRFSHEIQETVGGGPSRKKTTWSMGTIISIVVIVILIGVAVWGYQEIQSLRAAAGV